MTIDYARYAIHTAFLQTCFDKTDENQRRFIASWCQYRNFTNKYICHYVQKFTERSQFRLIKEFVEKTYENQQGKLALYDKCIQNYFIELIEKCSWDHESIVDTNASLEHQSWIAIMVLDSFEIFIRNYNKIDQKYCLNIMENNTAIADYIDSMNIGERENYLESEIEDQINFLNQIMNQEISSDEFVFIPNKIILK